jgi:chloramphenicol O-acetyltransferase
MVNFGESGAPAMRVHVYFITGGLVLSIYVHHAVMDCSGISHFWESFARNVSSMSEGDQLSLEGT